jgi:hypothetical protein
MKLKELKTVLPWILIVIMLFPLSFYLGVDNEGQLTRQVNTAKLTGIDQWLANIYNSQKFVFAIIVTTTMATVGILFALIADIILKVLGLEVTKIQHHE